MRIVICFLLLAALALTAAAADVSGTWSGSFKITTPDGGVKDDNVHMVLKQGGTELTGTAGPSEAQQLPIQKGKIEGDKITFDIQMGEGTLKFDLTLAGDRIKGDVNASRGEETMKAKVDVTRAK